MYFLIASILCSTGLYAIFKIFDRLGIRTFQAIVVNYFVAAGFGFWYSSAGGSPGLSLGESWMGMAVFLGALFISLFYIIALSSQRLGVSATSVAGKMSMVIPIMYFIISDPDENAGFLKIAGIVLGIAAVYLSSAKDSGTDGTARSMVWIPVVVFFGSGVLDLVLAYTEKAYLGTDSAYRAFTPVPFAVAGAIGSLILMIRMATGKEVIHLPSLVGGIVLGLVNYGSIYFLLLALGGGFSERSVTIPVNNMGIVGLSAVLGYVYFREKLNAKNAVGIIFSILAIAALYWSN